MKIFPQTPFYKETFSPLPILSYKHVNTPTPSLSFPHTSFPFIQYLVQDSTVNCEKLSAFEQILSHQPSVVLVSAQWVSVISHCL